MKKLLIVLLALCLSGCTSIDNSYTESNSNYIESDLDSYTESTDDVDIPDDVQNVIDTISTILPDKVSIVFTNYGENLYNEWYDYIQYYENIEIVNSNIRLFLYKDDSDMGIQVLGDVVNSSIIFDLPTSEISQIDCLDMCVSKNTETFKDTNIDSESYNKTCYVIKETGLQNTGILCYYYTDATYDLYIDAHTGDIISFANKIMFM